MAIDGVTGSYGKAAYVTNDPGKALLGQLAALKALKERPIHLLNQ